MKFRISKTTLNGILAFFIATVPFVQEHPELHISAKVMAWLSFLAGIARLIVGCLQTDAKPIPPIQPGPGQ